MVKMILALFLCATFGQQAVYGQSLRSLCAPGKCRFARQPSFFSMVTHPSTRVMGPYAEMTPKIPIVKHGGRFDFDGYTLTYSKTEGRASPYQWIGWRTPAFANKVIEVKFKINFVAKIPHPASFKNNFGVKVYGKIFNNWVLKCRANSWCDVTVRTKCAKAGDNYHVILIFDALDYKQQIQIRDFRVEFPETVVSTFSRPTIYMNKGRAKTVSYSMGKMQIRNDLVTYSKSRAGAAGYQWLGWRASQKLHVETFEKNDAKLANKIIRVSFWIKFVGLVPSPSSNFGMKIFGEVHNNWVSKCEKNKWCYVEMSVTNKPSGDGNHVILIFDSITQQTKIQVYKLQLQVIGSPRQVGSAYTTNNVLYMNKPKLPFTDTSQNKMIVANNGVNFNKAVQNYQSYLWMGWKDARFSNRLIRISADVKFNGRVPPRYPSNFGLKVYGSHYNKWLAGCKANQYCHVEHVIRVNRNGDNNHILMIFDKLLGKQNVDIKNFIIEQY